LTDVKDKLEEDFTDDVTDFADNLKNEIVDRIDMWNETGWGNQTDYEEDWMVALHSTDTAASKGSSSMSGGLVVAAATATLAGLFLARLKCQRKDDEYARA